MKASRNVNLTVPTAGAFWSGQMPFLAPRRARSAAEGICIWGTSFVDGTVEDEHQQ
jgi:hypothetical protein